jgi:TatD DNase family protein
MIDTPCHLTFPDFAPDKRPQGIAGVLATAREHGVTACITICTSTQDATHVLATAKAHRNVWCTAGVHPLYVDQSPHDWSALAIVARDEKCVAWGELGLDNHYTDPPSALQQAVLLEQLAFISSMHAEGIIKPIVIHCREAFADLLPILRASNLPANRFVFHCFTAGPTEVRHVLDFGASISFTGVATYRNANDLREAVKLVPLDRLMVETDAPYLSPHPHRGTRPCEPWMVSVTARDLAALRNEDWETFHAAINHNTLRFFNLPASALS